MTDATRTAETSEAQSGASASLSKETPEPSALVPHTSTPEDDHDADESWAVRLRSALSFRRISAAYILVALLVIFGLWIPDLFLQWSNFRTILFQQSVTAILAVGLVVPFAAGVFDASVGAMMGMASVLIAWMTVDSHMPAVLALVLTLAAGAVVGLLNAAVVIGLRVDSIIATLAMMSVLTGLGSAFDDGQIIVGLPQLIDDIGSKQIFGLALPVWLLLVLSLIVWYVLEKTIVGRHIYATGGGAVSARLAGVRTKRIVVGALIVAGVMSAIGGIVATGRVDAGQAQIGPPYLLSAFAATFLGATQIRPGRYNVWGTILATYTLATGISGLSLAGAPPWLPDVFNGVALALAVGLSAGRSRRRNSGTAASSDWRTRVRAILGSRSSTAPDPESARA